MFQSCHTEIKSTQFSMFSMFSITFYFNFQNLKPCRPNWLWYMCLFYIYFIIFIRTSILAIWFIAGLCLIYITSFALNVPRDYVHFIRHHSLFNTSSKFDFESDIPKHYDQEYDKKQHFCRYWTKVYIPVEDHCLVFWQSSGDVESRKVRLIFPFLLNSKITGRYKTQAL